MKIDPEIWTNSHIGILSLIRTLVGFANLLVAIFIMNEVTK
jgi:hypothetical protein